MTEPFQRMSTDQLLDHVAFVVGASHHALQSELRHRLTHREILREAIRDVDRASDRWSKVPDWGGEELEALHAAIDEALAIAEDPR